MYIKARTFTESVIRDIYSLQSVFKKKKMYLFFVTLLLFTTFNLFASVGTCDRGITFF